MVLIMIFIKVFQIGNLLLEYGYYILGLLYKKEKQFTF